MSDEVVDPKDHAVRADAVDRFDAEVMAATGAVYRALNILRESQGRSHSIYPKFAWGDRLRESLLRATDALHEAHREAAIQGYDEHVALGHIVRRGK